MGLSPNTTYNYRIEAQLYINVGMINIPTTYTDMIMTDSATTFPSGTR